jgi:hypothetical protein
LKPLAIQFIASLCSARGAGLGDCIDSGREKHYRNYMQRQRGRRKCGALFVSELRDEIILL